MQNRVILAAGIWALSSAAALPSALGEEAEPSPFAFGGPEVLKLNWTTRSLQVLDLNGDGLKDLALVNNDTAQIELLYQRAEGAGAGSAKRSLNRNRWDPVLEDARFEGEGITTGFAVFDLAAGDLNGDGLADLAYTSREVPLTIRYQNATGNWTETREFRNFEALGWPETVTIHDLNGDGRLELIVVAADALRIFSIDEEGELAEPELYFVTGENPFNLIIEDVNGDGRKDILYITASGQQSLALREQYADGAFGPERRFVFERPVRSVRVAAKPENAPVQFTAVDARSGGLAVFQLENEDVKAGADQFAGGQPEIYPLFKKGRRSSSSTLGDVNGDGLKDLVVVNPSKAELVLFEKTGGRFRAPQAFPTFSGVESITSGRFFEGSEAGVVVVSAEEKVVGVSRMGGLGRLSFPGQVSIGEGDPLVAEVVNLDDDAFDELALVTESDGKYFLSLARPKDRAEAEGAWELLSTLELEGVRRKPAGLKVVDLFGDDGFGLMVFVPREAPILLGPDTVAPFTLRAVAQGSAVRESLLKDVTKAQVSVFDSNGDGTNELVVGRAGYARALQVEGDELKMIDQFNARRGDESVSAVVPVFENGQLAKLVFYVRSAGEFQILEPGEDGVFRYRSAKVVGEIDLLQWVELAGEAGAGAAYLFAGEDRFWFVPGEASAMKLSFEAHYETELEDVHYTHAEAADFDNDGHLDIIAVDGKSHVVEILTREASKWRSRMYWEIFEQNLHYQGRTGGSIEPRQLVIEDVTGDGALDFIFLVHDRILIYLQL